MTLTTIGAEYLGDSRCRFTVWAPDRNRVTVRFPQSEIPELELMAGEKGYWSVEAQQIIPGTRYVFMLDGELLRPDPASHEQPDGVHNASAIVDHSQFEWQDSGWSNLPPEEMIQYEIHVGTFTPEGMLKAIIPRLNALKSLGVNTLNIMPVAPFPGDRNWGYDGVYPFGVHSAYGGPTEFKQLVDAAHQRDMAVVLDVVYNHLGPEGNYLRDFGPYFTGKYKTPWGEAINFDDRYSDEVRNFFIQNALYWFRHYHIDGLRLDAIHAIYDQSAKPFLMQLAEVIKRESDSAGKTLYLFPESSLHDTRILRPLNEGGFGHHAQWSDDFHHSVHTLLTGESRGYYADFGRMADLEKAITEGFVLDWKYSVFRARHHGSSSMNQPGKQFIVCVQNHDQIGNRLKGERFGELLSFEAEKLSAATLCLTPNIPLIFMGQEYREIAPFQYFVSHNDSQLIEAVRRGRREEFASFQWEGEIPDPQSSETFQRSKIHWELREQGEHRVMLNWYRFLLNLRRNEPALKRLSKKHLSVQTDEQTKVLTLHRWDEKNRIFAILHYDSEPKKFSPDFPEGSWQKIGDSTDKQWSGKGGNAPMQFDNEELTLSGFDVLIYKQES